MQLVGVTGEDASDRVRCKQISKGSSRKKEEDDFGFRLTGFDMVLVSDYL